MLNKKSVNWGIIGAGNIAKKMVAAVEEVAGAKVFGVASKSLDRAKHFAEQNNIEHYFSYQEIVNCEEVDVIYIATTHNFHFENAKLALEHNKHVIIEKPFTVNALQARELVRVAREKNLFLMEAIWTRFLPSINLIKNKIQEGEIGNVKEVDISFGNFVASEYEKRLKDPNLAGGVTLDMGIYPISFTCYILGELPVETKSMVHFSNLGVDEIANYMFRFKSGCFANIKASYNLVMKNDAIIYGDQGYIEFPNFQSDEKFKLVKHNSTNQIDNIIEFYEPNHINGFVYQVEEVTKCIKNAKLESNIIPLDESVAIMQIMDDMRSEWGLKYPFE